MHFSLSRTVLKPDHCDPLFLLEELGARYDYCALLESADRTHHMNDFSFLALGARDVLKVRDGVAYDSSLLPTGPVQDPLTPFEGFIEEGHANGLHMGYVGFLTYECARYFDAIELPTHPFLPDAYFFLPEIILQIDHEGKEVSIIHHRSLGVQIREIESIIFSSPYYDDRRAPRPLEALPTLEDIESLRQTDRESFCRGVEQMKEEIEKGEAFQIVLSQELKMKTSVDPTAVYEQLRAINPSPYMYYFRTPEMTIVGASPETLLRVEEGKMLYRPIAGTRKRTGDEAVDAVMRAELLSDEKERAEHQMLVDLGRNDLGRIAKIGSVAVEHAFQIEQYAHVYHIVSDITADLREGISSLDALRSVFPAGTVAGAPKVRAMEIIRDIEQSPRGVYAGAFGYIDQSGNIDFAIAIRTMVFREGEMSLRVGAGIVADSIPEHEDNECLHKARSCLAAIKQADSLHSS